MAQVPQKEVVRDPKNHGVQDPWDGEKLKITMAGSIRASPGGGHAPLKIELLGATELVDLLASYEVN
jgi:hypothetical protein